MKSKRSKILLVVVFLFTAALGGTAIFIGYRLSQEEEITPEESEAAGGAGSCCHPDVGCIAGWKCVNTNCDEYINPIGSSGCDGFGNDCTPCGGGRCPIWPSSPRYTCEDGKCKVYNAWTCVKRDDCTLGNTECASWFRDNKSSCEWPKVLFSGRPNGDFDVCRCGVCGGAQDPLDACSGNPPGVNDRCCDLGGCPSGYVSCGDSTNHEEGNCEKMEDISCTVFHPDCNNPSVIYRYCKSTQSDLECGDNCAGLEDDDCEGDLYCETTPDDGRLCLGADWRDCDVQEHIANDCSCPTDQDLSCENLTIDGQKSVTLTPGQAYSGILEATTSGTITSDISYSFETDVGYGSVDPVQVSNGTSQTSDWSITANQVDSLSSGTHSDVLYVTVSSTEVRGVCHNENTYCSNHGGIALTAPEEESSTWEDCWSWCQANWTSDYPICQKNYGNLCWLNYAPEGGVEACNWEEEEEEIGPWGGYCEELNDGGKGHVSCSLDINVGEDDCNCELIDRITEDDTIAVGALVPYIMTAGCEVAADEVEWSTNPNMEIDPGSRVPTGSEEALQHHIVFKVPEDAEEGDSYSVSALITGHSQVEECQDTFTVSLEEDPAYVAIKSSQVECINNNTAARITYTIHVRNVSGQEGTIEYIEDTYDSRFDSGWVANINPTPDSHSGNVIRWDNDDSGYSLAPNDGSEGGEDEVEFTYEVTVPAADWGDYVGDGVELYTFINNAIIKPEEQDPIELKTAVRILCLGTGFFDDAMTSILTGLFLVILGAVIYRFREYTYKYMGPVEEASSYVGLALRNSYSKSIQKTVVKLRKSFVKFKDKFKLSRKERFEKDTVERIDKEDK